MFRSALAAALCMAVAYFAGGCAIIGWTVATMAGPEKVPAEYSPPRGKTYLVLVDDVMAPAGFESVPNELTGALSGRLQREGIASDTVDYRDVVRLMSVNPEFNRLSVSEIGRQAGADVVVYVRVSRFDVATYPGSSTWHGEVESMVRVVDVHEQRRLWPEDRPAGFPSEPVRIENVEMETRDHAGQLSKMIAEKSADAIIQLFVEHEKPK